MTRARDGRTLTVTDDAIPQEAAAIAAAVDAYRRETEGADGPSTGSWDGERFRFAGRSEGLTGTPRRVPRGAPTDGWTTMGRLERYHD